MDFLPPGNTIADDDLLMTILFVCLFACLLLRLFASLFLQSSLIALKDEASITDALALDY